MVMGLCLFGAGMVLFWPAAVSGQYLPFLVALFAVGCGASILETAANPFMAQFWPATHQRAEIELCPGVQSSGNDSWRVGGAGIHPVGD